MKISRSEQREQAFTLVFEHIFNQSPIPELIDSAAEARDVEVGDYAKAAAEGTIAHLDEIDAYIERFTVGWQKKRISKASLAILRLAIYEICYESDVPTGVAINEAVNLAKKYAPVEDASFVNGLLGAMVRKLENEKAKQAGAQSAPDAESVGQ